MREFCAKHVEKVMENNVTHNKRGPAEPSFVTSLEHDATPTLEMVMMMMVADDAGSLKRCGRQGCAEIPTHGYRSRFSRTAKFCALHAPVGTVDLTLEDPAHASDEVVGLTSEDPASTYGTAGAPCRRSSLRSVSPEAEAVVVAV